ncbi:MAG: META domain-containing protein [Acidobacteriota bacterium]
MKYINTKIFLLAAAVAVFVSVPVLAKPDRLAGEKWELTQLNGRAVKGSNAFLEINDNKTKFTGNAGCNRVFGNLAVVGNRIEFKNVGMTRMACTDRATSRSEAALVKALEDTTRYSQIGNRLAISDRKKVVAEFAVRRRSEEVDDNGLDAKKWVLESVGNRRTLKALPNAFVVFDSEKRSVGGNSACNSFGGNYSVRGDRLTTSKIISTMRACFEDDRMTVQKDLFDGLRVVNRYKIGANRLYLYNGQKLLLTFRGERK